MSSLPDEWTYVIEANETQGVSPAIGTILGYERFSPGPVQTGVALGVSYGLEQNSNLHLSLGPKLRLQTLPYLMLTGGVALSRMERLDPNYEAGVVYQRDPTFTLEVPLVNRFDPSLLSLSSSEATDYDSIFMAFSGWIGSVVVGSWSRMEAINHPRQGCHFSESYPIRGLFLPLMTDKLLFGIMRLVPSVSPSTD